MFYIHTLRNIIARLIKDKELCSNTELSWVRYNTLVAFKQKLEAEKLLSSSEGQRVKLYRNYRGRYLVVLATEAVFSHKINPKQRFVVYYYTHSPDNVYIVPANDFFGKTKYGIPNHIYVGLGR